MTKQMTAPDKKALNIKQIWGFVWRFLIALCIIYFYPDLKHALFPDQMTRLEKMLRRSAINGCKLEVKRRDERLILLTVGIDTKSPFTTEIYKGVVRELETTGKSRFFFAHSINDNADGVTYLTRTLIEADADLKQVRRLEVSVCDRIKDQTGEVRYKDHEPIYECDVPIKKAVCLGASDQ